MGDWRTPPEKIPSSKITRTIETDIVVAGLGYSGIAATRAAAEHGARVAGIEMQERARYWTAGRDIGHINSEFLKSRGVPAVDPIDLYNEMLRRGGNRVNPSLIMQFCQNCGNTFDWFTDMYGADGLKDVHVAFWPNGAQNFKKYPGRAYNGYHFWNGTAQFPEPRGWPGDPSLQEVARQNLTRAESLGAELHFGVTVEQPVMDGKRVTGVIGKNRSGEYIQYLAKNGVLLATGGFAGNREMLQDLVTDIGDQLREDQPFPRTGGQKGIGHQIGVWAGGRLEPRPLPVMGGNYSVMKGISTWGVLWLDRNGRRFCNETQGGPEFCCLPATQMPQGTFYNIFDEHVLEDLQWAVPSHGGYDESNPQNLQALREVLSASAENPTGSPEIMKPLLKCPPPGNVANMIYSGRTPEELVKNSGISGALAEQIAASIHRYNKICERGRDDDFGKEACLLRPLSGRLYLQPVEMRGDYGMMLTTVGGFVTDENQNVLGLDYEPIPGLYATGNCCGRRFGMEYTTPISGISIGMAITLGRQAGTVMAVVD